MEMPQLDELYREVVLDHYRRPRGRTPVPHVDLANEGLNPVCGDQVRLALHMDGERIGQVYVESRGCSISVASGSMLAEILRGRTLAEAERYIAAFKALMHGEAPPADLDLGDLEALEGVRQFPVRIKCALLPWTTLEDALRAWRAGERPSAPSTTETDDRQHGPTAVC